MKLGSQFVHKKDLFSYIIGTRSIICKTVFQIHTRMCFFLFLSKIYSFIPLLQLTSSHLVSSRLFLFVPFLTTHQISPLHPPPLPTSFYSTSPSRWGETEFSSSFPSLVLSPNYQNTFYQNHSVVPTNWLT